MSFSLCENFYHTQDQMPMDLKYRYKFHVLKIIGTNALFLSAV